MWQHLSVAQHTSSCIARGPLSRVSGAASEVQRGATRGFHLEWLRPARHALGRACAHAMLHHGSCCWSMALKDSKVWVEMDGQTTGNTAVVWLVHLAACSICLQSAPAHQHQQQQCRVCVAGIKWGWRRQRWLLSLLKVPGAAVWASGCTGMLNSLHL